MTDPRHLIRPYYPVPEEKVDPTSMPYCRSVARNPAMRNSGTEARPRGEGKKGRMTSLGPH